MKYIAASKQMFLGENNQITQEMNKASKFNTFGDCMKACIKINNLLGKHIFKVYESN